MACKAQITKRWNQRFFHGASLVDVDPYPPPWGQPWGHLRITWSRIDLKREEIPWGIVTGTYRIPHKGQVPSLRFFPLYLFLLSFFRGEPTIKRWFIPFVIHYPWFIFRVRERDLLKTRRLCQHCLTRKLYHLQNDVHISCALPKSLTIINESLNMAWSSFVRRVLSALSLRT